jgi:hypothetical protein
MRKAFVIFVLLAYGGLCAEIGGSVKDKEANMLKRECESVTEAVEICQWGEAMPKIP